MSIVVKFQPPPSANKLWRPAVDRRGFAKLVKTRNYHSWIDAASWEIKTWMELRPAINGKVAVSVKVPHVHKGRDLDNCVKPIFDALQAGGAVVNDKQIIRFTFSWSPKEAALVEAELHEVAA